MSIESVWKKHIQYTVAAYVIGLIFVVPQYLHFAAPGTLGSFFKVLFDRLKGDQYPAELAPAYEAVIAYGIEFLVVVLAVYFGLAYLAFKHSRAASASTTH